MSRLRVVPVEVMDFDAAQDGAGGKMGLVGTERCREAREIAGGMLIEY